MRAVFVLATISLALALGIVAEASESRLLMRALVVGFIPVVWAASRLLERRTGRRLWHFGAPYPYRWMGDEPAPPPDTGGTSAGAAIDADTHRRVPFAA